MDLDNIPKDKKKGFPTGVYEQEYDTQAEILAYIDGLSAPDDIDIYYGEPFERDGKWVIRVCVGEWDEYEEDEDEEDDD